MSSNTGKRSGALFRSRRTADPVIPTPELQDLYSNFRIAEDRERVAVMNSNDPNLLPDMTMPRPTTLSRSTSNDAPSPEGQGRRSRGKRTGGLDPVKKAKTALVRKIGACAECRHRRIQVSALPIPYADFPKVRVAYTTNSVSTTTCRYSRKPMTTDLGCCWGTPTQSNQARLSH